MQPVGISVGEDAHLAIAQPTQLLGAGINTDRHGDIVHFLRGHYLSRIDFPGVENLAAQGHHRLEFAVARLLGRATGGITLDQKQLGARQILRGAVGELARQRRATGDLLAHHLAAGAQALVGIGQRQLRDTLAHLGVLIQPQAQCVLDHAGDEHCAFTRGQPFLGLAGELWIGQLDREHIAAAFPDILRGDAQAARHQIAELAELAHRIGQAAAQTVDMRAALRGGNQVDIAFHDRLATFRQPGQRPVGGFVGAADVADKRWIRQQRGLAERLAQIIGKAVLIMPDDLLAASLVAEADLQPRTQHGLGAQHMLKARHGEFGRIEIARIGPETHRGAGGPARHRADLGQIGHLVAASKGDVVLAAVAPHPDVKTAGQGIHHRHAHAVQATGKLVIAIGKLTAGMQAGQDQLDAGNAFLGVDIDRHAAAIVLDQERAVGIQHHADGAGVAGDGLVNAVVDHFLSQVVGPAGIGVHAGALADWVQAAEDFDGGGVVGRVHEARRYPGTLK